MSVVAAALARLALFVLLWLILAGLETPSLAFGIPGAAGAALLSLRLMPPGPGGIRAWAALRLAPGAAWRILLGAVDVSRRALARSMPLAPGWVVHRSRLPAGAPRLLLACETSLFPGSLVAARRDGSFLIHCLDRSQDVAAEFAREERRVAMATKAEAGAPVGGESAA